LRALDHRFTIRSTDGVVSRYLERVLGSLADDMHGHGADGSPPYSVVASADSRGYDLYLGDVPLVVAADADVAARHLLWHVNTEATRLATRHLVVHAAAAVCNGDGVVLPGRMNAGKTTLVTGLVLDGCGYLTDELVAFELTSGDIDAYPRPLSVGQRAWPLLDRLRPLAEEAVAADTSRQWHVDVGRLRPGAVASRARPRFVVMPAFDAGAPTTLEPVSRAAALETTYRHAMNAAVHGRAGFRLLAAVAGGCRAARLVSGDLEPAVRAVRRFMEESGPRR
jgi:hypothetical protein